METTVSRLQLFPSEIISVKLTFGFSVSPPKKEKIAVSVFRFTVSNNFAQPFYFLSLYFVACEYSRRLPSHAACSVPSFSRDAACGMRWKSAVFAGYIFRFSPGSVRLNTNIATWGQTMLTYSLWQHTCQHWSLVKCFRQSLVMFSWFPRKG